MVLKFQLSVLHVFLLIVVAVSARVDASTIDFETGFNGDSIGSDYIDQGLVFTNAYYASSPFLSENGSLVWVSGEADSSYNDVINISITGSFTGVTNFLSADIIYLDPSSTAYLDVFDIYGGLLASVSTTAGDSYEILSISTPGISSFSFSWASSLAGKDDVIGIDNLSYNSLTTVPLPAAVWLFGSGLIGLFGLSRLRKV